MNWRLRAMVAVLFAGMIALAGGNIRAQEIAPGQPPAPLEQAQQGRGRGGRGVFDGVMRELLHIVSDATGLSASELFVQVQRGATLTDLIVANGGTVEAVTTQATVVISERVQQAVSNGRLSQARADQMLAELPQRVQEVLNGETGRAAVPGRSFEQRLTRGVLELAAAQTGLTREQLRDALRTQSLEQVLTSQNVEIAGFIDSAAAQLQTQLNARVTDGRTTQAQADALVQTFRERLIERLSRTPSVSV